MKDINSWSVCSSTLDESPMAYKPAESIIEQVRDTIDIPIVITIISELDDIKGRIDAGATIFNVSGAKDIAKIVRKIREIYPDMQIIATGGPTDESILETIEAGANAITYTPPSNTEIMKELMDKYRGQNY